GVSRFRATVRRRAGPHRRPHVARRWRSGAAVTELALKNPIAVLTISLALLAFAIVVTPRMSVGTFPELTPPVLIVGEMAPGLAAKDVEKAVAWRIERYVAATPGA